MHSLPWLKTLIFSCVLVSALAGGKYWQKHSDIAYAQSLPEHSESVLYAHPITVVDTKTIKVFGELNATQRVPIYNEVAGRIAEVGFQSGELVSKGDVLIKLDSTEEVAMLSAAKVQGVLAESVYLRTKKLHKGKAISQEQLDLARANLLELEAEVARLEAIVRKKHIKAPFDAKAGIHSLEPGAFIEPHRFITELVGMSRKRWVEFSVPALYPELPVGSSVGVQAISHAPSKNRSAPWDAKILAIDATVDRTSKSRRYRGELILSAQVKAEGFVPGASVAVYITLPATEPEYVQQLPTSSILYGPSGPYIYSLEKPKEVADADKNPEQTAASLQRSKSSNEYRAQHYPVNIVNQSAEWVYIEKSLSESTPVASEGAFKLYPGVLVHAKATHY